MHFIVKDYLWSETGIEGLNQLWGLKM